MPTVNVGPGSDLELQDIADTIGKSRKVIVVTGAGISTNCGIPDFRSENGLYSLIQAQYDAALRNPPWEDKDEFDIDDRPKKKRKRWFYEVVRPDGTVVDVIDEDVGTAEDPPPTCPSPKSASPQQQPLDLAITHYLPPICPPLKPVSPQQEPNIGIVEDLVSTCPPPRFASPQQQSPSYKLCSSPLSSLGSTPKHTPIELHSIAHSTSSTRSQSPADSSTSESPVSSQTSQSGAESSQSTRAELPNLKGRDLFDSMVWKNAFTTSIFYMFISTFRDKIRKDVQSTTETHRFIRALQEGGRLVRNYTQNIDGLESREGLSTDLSFGPGSRARFHAKTQRELRPRSVDRDSAHFGGVACVQLHGNLDGLRCGLCGKLSTWGPAQEATTAAGSAPDCPSCVEYTTKRTGRGRRGLAIGRLRPDIVLYGEEHPQASLIGPLVTHDIGICPDVLLIMGTSLKVHGLKIIVKEFANAVHDKGGKVIFVNHTKPPESTWGDVIDFWVEWDCDAWVINLKERRRDIWLPQGTVRIPEETKSRRDSSGAGKTDTRTRPMSTRMCRSNGAYQTFRILDLLGMIKDENGQIAARPIYWEESRRITSSAPVRQQAGQKRKSMPATATTAKPNATSTKIVNSSKPRKSYPQSVRDHKLNGAYLTTKIWENLRKFADTVERAGNITPEDHNPHLPPSIREWVGNLQKSAPSLGQTPAHSGRIAFEELTTNAPLYIKNWAAENPGSYHKTVSTYISSYTPLPNLLTHPPSGATLPLHTPKHAESPVFQPSNAKESTVKAPIAKSSSAKPATIEPAKSQGPKSSRRSTVTSTQKAGTASRNQTACDFCRQHKVRCDQSNSCCSRCGENGNPCTINGKPNPQKQNEGSTKLIDDVSNAVDDAQKPIDDAHKTNTLAPLHKPSQNKPLDAANDSETSGQPAERKAVHTYGTRASRRWSTTESTIVVESSEKTDDAATPTSCTSREDTIVVTSEDLAPPAKVGSRRTSTRIKDMGMISAILSSPSKSESSVKDIFYDAEETL